MRKKADPGHQSTKKHQSHAFNHPLRWMAIGVVLALAAVGCTIMKDRPEKPTLQRGYAMALPDETAMTRLHTIAQSVKKLSCYAEYTTLVFPRNAGINESSDFTALSAQAVSTFRTPESVIGTVTILSYSPDRVLAVTCAHVVDFPDTVFTYHEPDITGEALIYTVSIKKSQINYVKELPVAGGLIILATDRRADIALLGGKLTPGITPPPALNIPLNRSPALEMGNRAWVFGFPIGYKMLTEALVNNPDVDQTGSFMLDAVFNPGFSGGLTVAYNLSSQQFEAIGIGRSAPSSPQLVLTPAGTPGIDRYPPLIPYTDKVFVQQRAELAYGLTFVTSTLALTKLLISHRESLINQGYNVSFIP